MSQPRAPRIEIEYRTGCRWLPRGAWMAQELLTTFFLESLEELALMSSGARLRTLSRD
jgi:selenoprotein W-related protein